MRRFSIFATCVALLVAPVRADEDKKEERKPERRAAVVERAPAVWIGAMCVPADERLQAKLDIEDGGLVVVRVVPDSPAAKAGLKEDDVVVAVDGKQLEEPSDLLEAVAAAGEKKLKLEIVRGGEKKTIEVTPAPRPTEDVLRRFAEPGFGGAANAEQIERMREMIEKAGRNLPEGERHRMQEWMERAGRGEQGPFKMHTFGPGVVMQPGQYTGFTVGGQLPDDVTVTIKKKGREATAIQVERGEESWTIKEDELDRLPPDLRGPVAMMLGKGPQIGMPNPGMPNPAGGVVFGGTAAGGAAVGSATGTGPIDVQIRIDGNPTMVRTFTVPATPPNPQLQNPPSPWQPGISHRELEALQKQVAQLQRQVEEMSKLRTTPAPTIRLEPKSEPKQEPKAEPKSEKPANPAPRPANPAGNRPANPAKAAIVPKVEATISIQVETVKTEPAKKKQPTKVVD